MSTAASPLRDNAPRATVFHSRDLLSRANLTYNLDKQRNCRHMSERVRNMSTNGIEAERFNLLALMFCRERR